MMDASPKRDKLTALIDSCFSFGNVLGPLVSVAAYAATGLAGMLLLNALSYFFSAALAYGIKLKPKSEADIRLAQEENKLSVLLVLKSKPVISGMLVTFLLMNFFLAPLMIFMPWYAKNIFSEGITGLAKLETFFAVGTVVGGGLLSFVQLPGSTANRIALSLCAMALSYLLFTSCHNLIFACFALGLLGFFLALANVLILTFFQTSPKEEEVPIVMGMVNLISVASLPISMGIVGAFIDNISVPSFASVCALIVVAIAISIRFIPGIRAI
jgi:MFS family permease